jgi:hypothetical protein
MRNRIRTKRGSADALHVPEAGAPLRGVARFSLADVMHPTTFRQNALGTLQADVQCSALSQQLLQRG